MKKTIVYIDGQNFLYKVADILVEAGFVKTKQDVSDIDIPWLLSQALGDDLEIRFYGVKKISRGNYLAEEMKEKSKIFADNLRKVKNCLDKTGVEFVGVGALKVRDTDECKNCQNRGLHFQEKGVDVGLAVDLVKDVLLNNMDRAILVSSDTDLIPAVLVAKEAKKEIVYVGFENRITKALVSVADSIQVLRKKEVIESWERLNTGILKKR